LNTKRFPGFPARSRFTPLPNIFFSVLLAQIDDLSELKVTLHLFWALYQKRGYPRFVTHRELSADKTLMNSIPTGALPHALEQAAKRGSILHLSLERDGEKEDIYLLNSDSDRRAAAKIQRGELSLGGLSPQEETYVAAEERADIFALYEQNIGLLTPMIAEELKEAEKTYPTAWIESAFKEAVSSNKRSWKYIARILERWLAEGKDDGKPGGHPKKGIDPDKYIKGKYGHLVRR
jgi:DnaD/phage-associated family protein